MTTKKTTLRVDGMTCNHCKHSVTDALERLSGVTGVEVDLTTGRVVVEHEVGMGTETMARAVEDVGFEVS